MRYLEWLFPIHRYIRRGHDVSGLRVVVTIVLAAVVQWFAAGVLLEVGPTSDSIWQQIGTGLVGPFVEPDTETTTLQVVFTGSLPGVLLLAYGLGCVLLLLTARSRGQGWPGTLAKFVVLGSQSWALCWVLCIVWLPLAERHFELAWVGLHWVVLFWLRFSFWAGVVVFVTGWQAARATRVLCSVSPPRGPANQGAA